MISEKDMKKVEKELEGFDANDSPRHTQLSASRQPYYQGGNNSQSYSSSSNNGNSTNDSSYSYNAKGVVELPFKYDQNELVLHKRARTSVQCHIPPSQNARWSATATGSTLIKGPLGCANGGFNVEYHLLPNNQLKLQGGMVVGSTRTSVFGLRCRPLNSTSWYSLQLGMSPNSNYKPTTSLAVNQAIRQDVELMARINLQPTPSGTTSATASMQLSSKRYPMQLGASLNSLQRPQLSFAIFPKLNTFRTLRVNCTWRSPSCAITEASLQQSQNSKVGSFTMGIRHHSQEGLAWIFQFVRGDLTIRIPIHLTATASGAWYATALQSLYLSLISFLVQEALADLWRLPEINEHRKQSRQVNQTQQTLGLKLKADAEKQQRLMETQANKRLESEKEKNGLIIVKALYYCQKESSWDVTIPLRFWTHKSSLELNASTKRNMLGFYDVLGVETAAKSVLSKDAKVTKWWQIWKALADQSKSDSGPSSTPLRAFLTVRYELAGSLYEITVQDNEPLSLPSNQAKLLLN